MGSNKPHAALLQGRRIVLKLLTTKDVTDRYLRWMNDPEINRYLESRFVIHTRASLIDFVQKMENDPQHYFWGIFTEGGKEHIGNIKLGPIHPHHLHGDIGLMIGERAAWGQGYASEAIGLVTDFSFTKLNLHKLTAGCYGNNMGSAKAFQKVGFTLQGTRRSHYRSDQGFVDLVLLELINPVGKVA